MRINILILSVLLGVLLGALLIRCDDPAKEEFILFKGLSGIPERKIASHSANLLCVQTGEALCHMYHNNEEVYTCFKNTYTTATIQCRRDYYTVTFDNITSKFKY